MNTSEQVAELLEKHAPFEMFDKQYCDECYKLCDCVEGPSLAFFPCDVHRMAELKDAEIAELRREISEHVLRADSLRAELARVNEELESCEGENADLRSQLERSLTPKFSKGERAFLADSHAEGIIVTVTDEMWIEYEIIDERGGISDCMESSLSPLPEEPKPCEHREWKGGPRFSEIHLNVRGAFPFCPLCGASLTKETP